MHSHDRTQIAQYGFADPDKRNPRHDLACQYLAQKEVANKVVRRYWTRLSGEEDTGDYDICIRNEEPLSKGKDQYKTVIGFIDLTYSFTFKEDNDDYMFFIEVKCNPISVSDILRQIKFYREWVRSCDKYYEPIVDPREFGDCKTYYKPCYDIFEWVVVLDFDISEHERRFLESENCLVFRLGADFDRWIEEQGLTVGHADQSWDESGS